ncbi:MAG TPA: protein kinase [Ktedonobacteraceae bacterium]|jgi:serine/threonine protein kinase
MTLAGQQLGHYRLTRLIKQGGMGEVYLAEDIRMPRQVAIKVVRNEHNSYPDSKALQQAERLFQREMKAISQLDHPHILSFYDFGEEPSTNGSIIYMVMPYRPEGSLLTWLVRRGDHQLPLQDAGHMIAQAASALQHAHEHNIIHQDVKPSNFLVRTNPDHPTRPDLFLVDFGIARVMSATSTTTNSIRGTTSYMAPEQWSGDATPASDQYALAVMSYLLLTSQLPFKGRPEQMMFRHLTEPPKPPSQLNPLLSPAIDAVILRALAKESDERFPTIKAFAIALQQALDYTDQSVMLTISRTEALRGGRRTVTLSDGREVTATIPPDAQHGQVLHLPDQGFPYYDSGPRGPLLLTLSTDQNNATSLLISADENDIPTEPAIAKKRSFSTPPINKPVPHINQSVFSSQTLFDPALSPSGTTPRPNNLALASPRSGVILRSNLADNRNVPSKQRTILFITVALLLLMIGSVLAVASINNTIATNNANATATTQSIIRANATATALSIIRANATATAQAIANSTATAIAANPDPYQPPNGTLALQDPLNQPNVWRQASDTNSGSQCQFANAGYQVSQPQPNKLYQCYEGNQYSNFAFEVQMTINKGDCGGLAIRSQSNYANLYLFQVCQDGSYNFYKYTLNSTSSPTTLTRGNPLAIKEGVGQSNTIAVIANGSNIDLYINGQKVGSASDSAYSQGSIGLVASAYNNATTVTYQNARVWTIK